MTDDFSLEGRKALVTGASRGIGRGIALAYARAGADVALLARDAELLGEVANEIRAMGRTAVTQSVDLLDADAARGSVALAIAELGGLDILVNNAGGNSFSIPFSHMRFSGWEKTMRLNLDGVVHVTQASADALIDSAVAGRGAAVINMSSVAGLGGAPLMSHYAAAKAALVSLTQSLAVEWARTGIRVNALCPGWIETDLTDFLRGGEDAGAQFLDASVPMNRWGTVEEIAAPAVFLASPASAFMTGQVLVVDGGLTVMP